MTYETEYHDEPAKPIYSEYILIDYHVLPKGHIFLSADATPRMNSHRYNGYSVPNCAISIFIFQST